MKDKTYSVEKALAEFKKAYAAKRKLIEREREDFLFALGKQWDDADVETLRKAGAKAVTDNRIQPNIFLLTGLERQNRSEFKAFPEGEEDSLKAEIASALFKHAIKVSDFGYKSSEQFKDGITCGESHLELYLDNTENLLNGKPCWKKVDGNCLFPEPGFREYDFNDARYVYKLTEGLSADDIIGLYPDAKKMIEDADDGRVSLDGVNSDEKHRQYKDYRKHGGNSDEDDDTGCFDLIERYYKKFVDKTYVGDHQTGTIQEAESPEKADEFVFKYKEALDQEQMAYSQALQQFQGDMANYQAMGGMALDPMTGVPQMDPMTGQPAQLPPPEEPMAPPEKDPERFKVFKRKVPEIWVYAFFQGAPKPLADERAWFYPKWKKYPFLSFFARFSTAPIRGDDRHLLVQGIVHGAKNAQERHNKSETLLLRHLNTTANSGWLAEENSWVDPDRVKAFGSTPGINLEYKAGTQKPERIHPAPLSQGHAQLAEASAEAIKAQLGINADLLAVQEGGQSSGRAIALRQRQGLLMIQELFDNLTRTRINAGKFLLTQLGEIYDTETASKVLGDAFMQKQFPAPMMMTGEMDPMSGQPKQEPMADASGKPMAYDKEMAELVIAEVLSGDLGTYDVTVGESVASETTKLANAAEVKEIATAYPGLIPPQIIIEESQLPQSTKTRVMAALQQAQQAAQAAATRPPPGGPGGGNPLDVAV